MKQTTQKVDYAFLKSKLFSGFNTWAQREIDFDAQSTNMSRLSDSVFSFIEYNYLPSCETDILDGHYTFFVNKDTFEYLVYKSSDTLFILERVFIILFKPLIPLKPLP